MMRAAQEHALMQEIASVAAATAGFSVAAMDSHIFAAALKRRMRATSTGDTAAYAALHRESAAEREAYLEEVLIGETSFFRDAAVFAEMTRWALAWTASHGRPAAHFERALLDRRRALQHRGGATGSGSSRRRILQSMRSTFPRWRLSMRAPVCTTALPYATLRSPVQRNSLVPHGTRLAR